MKKSILSFHLQKGQKKVLVVTSTENKMRNIKSVEIRYKPAGFNFSKGVKNSKQ